MEIEDTVVSKLENIWASASFPVVTLRRIIEMIKNLHGRYKSIVKSLRRYPDKETVKAAKVEPGPSTLTSSSSSTEKGMVAKSQKH